MKLPFKFLEIDQGSDEWKLMRSHKIGASEAPILMGVSPWKTPLQLYNEKLYGSQQSPSSSMQRGLDLEKDILKEFNTRRGELFVPAVIESIEYPFMIASLDGINLHNDSICEIKTANKDEHDLALDCRVPEKYYPQVQHQMAVSGLQFMYYVSEHKGNIHYFRVMRNDEYIENLIHVEKEFYNRILSWNPPPACERDYIVVNDQEIKELVEEYIYQRKQLVITKTIIDHLEGQLKERCPQQNWQCGELKCTMVSRKGNVDYSAIPELNGVCLDNYRKPDIKYSQYTFPCL